MDQKPEYARTKNIGRLWKIKVSKVDTEGIFGKAKIK